MADYGHKTPPSRLCCLAEAFTGPKVMHQWPNLVSLESYTYLPASRNAKAEIRNYFIELTQTGSPAKLRANLWPNTPDILTDFSARGLPGFKMRCPRRTLGAKITGSRAPAFEISEKIGRFAPGSERVSDSEKLSISRWDRRQPQTPVTPVIAQVESASSRKLAIAERRSLQFHPVDNESDNRSTANHRRSVEHSWSQWSIWILYHKPLVGRYADGCIHIDRVSRSRCTLLADTRYVWRARAIGFQLDPQRRARHTSSESDGECETEEGWIICLTAPSFVVRLSRTSAGAY